MRPRLRSAIAGSTCWKWLIVWLLLGMVSLGGCAPAEGMGGIPAYQLVVRSDGDASGAPQRLVLEQIPGLLAPTPTETPTSTPSPTCTPAPTSTRTVTPTIPPPTPTPTYLIADAKPPEAAATEIYIGNRGRPYVALTFDADAGADPALLVLETLKDRNARATFFLQGWWVQRNPELVQRMVKDGHEIGNHSDTHPDFRTLTEEQMVAELTATEALVQETAQVSTKPYFRPPYGGRNDLAVRVAAEQGYLTIIWTFDVLDWKDDATQESITHHVLDQVTPGAIYVLHLGDANSAAALGDIIDGLRAQGVEPATLSQVLAP